VIAAAGLLAARARPGALWPWLAVAAATVALWLPTGNMPGLRRAIPLSIVAVLVLAVALDVVRRALPRELSGTVPAAIALVVALPLLGLLLGWQQAHLSGREQVRPDFAIAPGPMPTTLRRYYDQFESGTSAADDMLRTEDGIRILTAVWMLADRNGEDTSRLPSPARIVAAQLELQRPATLDPRSSTASGAGGPPAR
jgi:hypothetical protein